MHAILHDDTEDDAAYTEYDQMNDDANEFDDDN